MNEIKNNQNMHNNYNHQSSSIQQASIRTPEFMLPGPWNLLKQSLKVFKERFWVLIGLMVIPLIFVFVGSFITLGMGGLLDWFKLGTLATILTGLFIFILSILGAIFYTWALISLFYAIKERDQRIGIRESFSLGWHKILSFLWVGILAGAITIAGYFLFVIPGIIFNIWFFLVFYVLVSEDLIGLNVLFRSKQLIKRYWWKVFWRSIVLSFILVLFSLPVIIIAVIATIIENSVMNNIADFMGNIFALLTTPFSIIFGFLIYENLKRLKSNIQFESPERKTKVSFVLLAIIGAIIIPALISASFVWIFFNREKDTIKQPEIAQQVVNWETYRNDEYGFKLKYPKEWFKTEVSIDGTKGIEFYPFKESQVNVIITFIKDPSFKTINLEQYVDYIISSFREEAEDLGIILEIVDFKNVSFNNVLAHKIVIREKLNEYSPTIKLVQHLIIIDDKMFTIAYSSIEEKDSDYSDIAEQIIDSIEFF